MTTTPPASSATGRPRWRARPATLAAIAAAAAVLAAVPAVTASAAPPPATTAATVAKVPASVTGAYTLHFSWGCTSHYSDTAITFNPAAGTFATGDGGNGIYGQANDELFWQFANSIRTTYGGTIDGSVGSGASATTNGLNGCWYLTAAGTTGTPPRTAHPGQAPDSAGHR